MIPAEENPKSWSPSSQRQEKTRIPEAERFGRQKSRTSTRKRARLGGEELAPQQKAGSLRKSVRTLDRSNALTLHRTDGEAGRPVEASVGRPLSMRFVVAYPLACFIPLVLRCSTLFSRFILIWLAVFQRAIETLNKSLLQGQPSISDRKRNQNDYEEYELSPRIAKRTPNEIDDHPKKCNSESKNKNSEDYIFWTS